MADYIKLDKDELLQAWNITISAVIITFWVVVIMDEVNTNLQVLITLGILILGTIWYNWFKYYKLKEKKE